MEQIKIFYNFERHVVYSKFFYHSFINILYKAKSQTLTLLNALAETTYHEQDILQHFLIFINVS